MSVWSKRVKFQLIFYNILIGGNDLPQLAKEGAVDRVMQCLKKLMESRRDDWIKIRDAKTQKAITSYIWLPDIIAKMSLIVCWNMVH